MKQALTGLLALVNGQMAFITQLAADVAALKTVVRALSPNAAAALEEQIGVERVQIQQHLEGLRVIHAALQTQVSELPN